MGQPSMAKDGLKQVIWPDAVSTKTMTTDPPNAAGDDELIATDREGNTMDEERRYPFSPWGDPIVGTADYGISKSDLSAVYVSKTGRIVDVDFCGDNDVVDEPATIVVDGESLFVCAKGHYWSESQLVLLRTEKWPKKRAPDMTAKPVKWDIKFVRVKDEI